MLAWSSSNTPQRTADTPGGAFGWHSCSRGPNKNHGLGPGEAGRGIWLARGGESKGEENGGSGLVDTEKSFRVGIEPTSTPHLSSLGKVVQC